MLKDTLNFTVMNDVDGTESCWARINSFSPPIIVGGVYRPPNADLSFLENLYSHLTPIVKKNKHVIIAGDFNLPNISWENLSPLNHNCTDSVLLTEMSFNLNLYQTVTTATRVQGSSSNTLDLVFVSSDVAKRTFSCEVSEGISDHRIVVFEYNPSSVGCASPARRSTRRVYDIKNALDESVIDQFAIKHDVFLSLYSSPENNVNEMWLYFKNLVHGCLNLYVPKRTLRSKNHNKPWLTRNIIHLKRRIHRLRKNKHNLLLGEYTDKMREQKQVLNNSIRKSKYNFFNVSLPRFLITDPRKFWRYISPKKEQLDKIIVDGVDVTAGKEMSTAFNQYFSSVFSQDNGVEPSSPDFQFAQSLPDIAVSEEGVFASLLSLDTKKSSGPDDIPNEFLMRYAEWCSKYLYCLFEKSLREGSVPDDWKCARVVPIHKSGSTDDTTNYRPISLLCTVNKLLEHIVHNHISSFLETTNVICSEQHGFRRKLSTTTQLTETVHYFSEIINKRGQTDVIFLDFSKAFDRVSHPKLLVKLSKLLPNGKVLRWIKDYLCNRKQLVEVKKERSSLLPVHSGVPQGSVLGPLLFLVYINDVVKDNININFRLFADDLVIFSEIKNGADQANLNLSLKKISDWCQTWQMQLNLEKCVSMTITRKKSPLVFSYSLNNSALQQVSSFKYLGVTISSDLRWNAHIDSLCQKAMFKLWYLKRNLRHSTSATKLIAYKSLIRPLLEYADIIWDPHTLSNINKLERIQKRALRFIYNKYKRLDSVSALYSIAGIQPLQTRRKINRLTFLYTLINDGFRIDRSRYVTLKSARSTRSYHALSLTDYQCHTDCFKFSFFPKTITEWNELPFDIVNTTSIQSFKASLFSLFK